MLFLNVTTVSDTAIGEVVGDQSNTNHLTQTAATMRAYCEIPVPADVGVWISYEGEERYCPVCQSWLFRGVTGSRRPGSRGSQPGVLATEITQKGRTIKYD